MARKTKKSTKKVMKKYEQPKRSATLIEKMPTMMKVAGTLIAVVLAMMLGYAVDVDMPGTHLKMTPPSFPVPSAPPPPPMLAE